MLQIGQGVFSAGVLLFLMLYLLVSLVTGLIGYGLASSKGRGGLGFALGFFLSLIGLIIAALLDPSDEEIQRRKLTGAGAEPAPVVPPPISGDISQRSVLPGYCANCNQPLRNPLCAQCGYMNGEASK